MRRYKIGIIDYDVGNYTSIRQALNKIECKSFLSQEHEELEQADLLLLAGVGAFPQALQTLKEKSLDNFIIDWADKGKPIIGICLGMQLLAESSKEIEYTRGLNLIPGRVLQLSYSDWHIGWNNIEVCNKKSFMGFVDGEEMYFNHSYVFHTPLQYQLAVSRIVTSKKPFPVAICKDKIVGLQFHPEKSQQAGRILLNAVIKKLCCA